MRRRLTLTIVGLVVGALLLAGGGALVVASLTARHRVVDQLVRQDETLAGTAATIRTPAVLRLVGRVLRLDRADLVVVDASGHVVDALPRGLGALQLPRLPATPQPRSGVRGSLAYAVEPVRLDRSVSGPLPAGDWTAVLLSRRVGALVPDWGFFFWVAGAIVAVAAGVAAALSRRITRPLAAASEVTGRIASGQLDARVPEAGGRDELDSLARSINSMAATLERSRQHETELLASISHDLRTPLTSIRGYAEAIADGVADDPRRAAGVICDQARRLERLVGDLLDLAKVRARHLPLQPVAVDMAVSVGQVIDAAGPEARRVGVVLRSETDGTTPVAHADPDRLAQVLTNLVHNAVAHAGSTVVVRFGRTAPTGSDAVWVAVDDDGPGIPADELARVFDRFYQIDRGAAARAGGSGLGLSIVAELASAMGGAVRAASPVSPDPARPGSRFVVTLPGAPPVPHVHAAAAAR